MDSQNRRHQPFVYSLDVWVQFQRHQSLRESSSP